MKGIFPHDSDGAARAHIGTMAPALWRGQKQDLLVLRSENPERYAHVRGDVQLATLDTLLVGDMVQARADAAMIAAGARAEQLAATRESPDEIPDEVRAAARRIEGRLTQGERTYVLLGQSVMTLWLGCFAECDGRRVATRPPYQPALVALGWADAAMTEEEWTHAGS